MMHKEKPILNEQDHFHRLICLYEDLNTHAARVSTTSYRRAQRNEKKEAVKAAVCWYARLALRVVGGLPRNRPHACLVWDLESKKHPQILQLDPRTLLHPLSQFFSELVCVPVCACYAFAPFGLRWVNPIFLMRRPTWRVNLFLFPPRHLTLH